MDVFALVAALASGPSTAEAPPRAIDPQHWFRPDDFPADEWGLRSEGKTTVEVTVGQDGKPLACDVGASSGSPVLDRSSCRIIMERGRFEPAMGGRGQQRLQSTWRNEIVWRLPAAAAWPNRSWAAVARARFDESGAEVACSPGGYGPVPYEMQKGCAILSALPRSMRELLLKGHRSASSVVALETIVTIDGQSVFPLSDERKEAERVGEISRQFDVGSDGSVANCRIAGAEGVLQPLSGRFCAVAAKFETGPGGVVHHASMTMRIFVEPVD